MPKMPSIAEALDEPSIPNLGRGRIKKNIHWVIGGAVVVVLAIILLSQAFKMEENGKAEIAETKRMERIKEAAIGQKPDDIQDLLDQQKKAGIKNANETNGIVVPDSLVGTAGQEQQPQQRALPPLPKGEPKPGYAGMNPPTKNDEVERQEIQAQKTREQASRAANILAIDTGYRDTGGKGAITTEHSSPILVGGSSNAGARGRDAAMADLQRQQAEIQSAQEKYTQQREQLLRSAMNGNTAGGGAFQDATNRGAIAQNGAQADNRWAASQATSSETPTLTVKTPAGPYMILQGTVIPAVLITEVNSDLPGQLTAQVTSDVYDSIRGEHLLIPKGSRLVGQYNNDTRIGQERVMAAFRRLILRDGSYVDLMGMQGADAQGQSGMHGEVDNHFFKMFGPSLFSASLAWLLQRNQQGTTVVVNNYSQQGSYTNAAGQILVDTTKKITDRTANIMPTITIQQGFRFNIIANRDISMTPQKSRF